MLCLCHEAREEAQAVAVFGCGASLPVMLLVARYRRIEPA